MHEAKVNDFIDDYRLVLSRLGRSVDAIPRLVLYILFLHQGENLTAREIQQKVNAHFKPESLYTYTQIANAISGLQRKFTNRDVFPEISLENVRGEGKKEVGYVLSARRPSA